MKIYGQLIKATIENTASDLADSIKGLLWFNTTSNVAKFYDGAVIRTIVDTDSTQNISGKSISASEIEVKKDTVANLTTYALTSGDGKICFSTDEKQFYFTSNNILNEVSVMKTISGVVTNAQVAVGTTAVRATVSGSAPNAARKKIMITPLITNGSIFIGGSSVTIGNGKPIIGPDTIILEWDASDYYLVSDVVGNVVSIVEVV